MSLEVIAKNLKEMHENIILVYGFNDIGKTQLSVAYKNLTKTNGGKHTGVYYNAFSEDLFVWDNDEENDGANIKLNVLPSSLNQFHSFLYENNKVIKDKLASYDPKYHFRLNMYDDLERGIESVTFFKEENEDTPIKISRGEESIFVWCFYLALFDVGDWTKEQDSHIFIDDPVSSLDEHNIFITVNTIFQQIASHFEKKRIIITTHHIGLFSILSDRLTKGEKSGRYKNLTAIRIIKRVDNKVVLEEPKQNVFLYHLHILQVLEKASKNQLYNYQFSLLRQLLENISSFQGSGHPGRLLNKLGFSDEEVEKLMVIVNTHSHKTPYYYRTEMMNETDQKHFNDIFTKLRDTYHFTY